MKRALLATLAVLLLTGAVTAHKVQGAACPFCRVGHHLMSLCK
ncbi:MAG TPA: hypothetical protein VIO12_01160 [Thermoanaerobaculia bacterium]